MRMYADYIKDRSDVDCKYNGHCFITYKVHDVFVSVHDSYCDKTKRGTGYWLEFANEFLKEMKEAGHTTVFANVDTTTPGWERNEKVFMEIGFKRIPQTEENLNNFIILLEEI